MSDETLRLTYGELAKARGISLSSARRMTLRRRWPKAQGNDGLTRVDVPASALDAAKDASTDDSTDAGTDAIADAGPAVVRLDPATVKEVVDAIAAATADDRSAERQLTEVLTCLTTELIHTRERADRAEARVKELERRWWKRKPWKQR
jgi:hypothetical protein